MPDNSLQKTMRIRDLNDLLRRTLLGGRIMLTRGVADMGPERTAVLLAVLRSFDQFDEGNDPHGEHDFGAIEHEGTKFFWKIDYYDPSMTYHSDDASDPTKTVRVLTLMLAEEY